MQPSFRFAVLTGAFSMRVCAWACAGVQAFTRAATLDMRVMFKDGAASVCVPLYRRGSPCMCNLCVFCRRFGVLTRSLTLLVAASWHTFDNQLQRGSAQLCTLPVAVLVARTAAAVVAHPVTRRGGSTSGFLVPRTNSAASIKARTVFFGLTCPWDVCGVRSSSNM